MGAADIILDNLKIENNKEIEEPEKPAGDISTAVLKYAVELAEKVDMSGAMDAVKENFDQALQTAKDVLAKAESDDGSVTQSEIDSAWQNLIKAMQYGEFKPGDKTDLEKVIALAEEMSGRLDKYLEEGKDEFLSALERAKEVYADGNAFQEDVESAWQNLIDAMADLRLKPDKDLLEDLIAQAEGLNEADYEAQSFAVMRTALVAAKDVFDKEDATQEEIDASAAALKDAIAQLTTTGSGEEPGTGMGDSGTTGTGSAAQNQGQTADTADKSNDSSSAGKTASAKGSAVKTGDTANVLPFVAAAAAAVLAAGAVVTLKRRKKEN